jgi:putative DNA primase/helicase
VLAERGRYVAAVLTIARAYLAAGCPNLRSPLASFEGWSRMVRSPLVWLGRPDLVRTMEAARADNPALVQLHAVVTAWQAVISVTVPLTAAELKDRAYNDRDLHLLRALSLIAVQPGRSEIDPVRLGQWLGRNRGRVANGLKIVSEADRHTKQQKWWLAEL